MSFTHNIENVVQVTEGVGVAILIVGGLSVMAHSLFLYAVPSRRASAYRYFRTYLGRTIMLGLEVLITADIVRTVIIDQSLTSVVVLATTVLIRIILSWTLAVEVDGFWPWRRPREVVQPDV